MHATICNFMFTHFDIPVFIEMNRYTSAGDQAILSDIVYWQVYDCSARHVYDTLRCYISGKKINRVACGSAHSLAWSTNKPVNAGRLPPEIPMEYNHLQCMEIPVLRNRLVLLHHFSDHFCPCIPMFELDQSVEEMEGVIAHGGPDTMRGVLVSTAKETAFRKVVQATMIRDRQHGPVIEINRIQVQ